ncbi:MAG: hypothetical protein AAF416_22500 [Pseudomonadota bacterium]
MTAPTEHRGMAALSICEALLLAIIDRGLLSEHEVLGAMHDAATAHENAVGTDAEMDAHRAAARIIERMIEDSTWGRRR